MIEVATSLPAARVVQVLEVLTGQRGHPDGIVLDNGPEFIAHAFLRWAARTGTTPPPPWTERAHGCRTAA